MTETRRLNPILPHLDKFQQMKQGRMKCLLQEIETLKEIHISKFLSYIAVRYGIRRDTGLEYIKDWCDGGYISVHNDIIKFIRKPEWWE